MDVQVNSSRGVDLSQVEALTQKPIYYLHLTDGTDVICDEAHLPNLKDVLRKHLSWARIGSIQSVVIPHIQGHLYESGEKLELRLTSGRLYTVELAFLMPISDILNIDLF